MYHFHISPYSTCIIMIIGKYIHIHTYIYIYKYIYIYIYILKHTINYGDLLSVCDICILCIV